MKNAVYTAVKQNLESKLSDRAKKFGVNPTAIFYAGSGVQVVIFAVRLLTVKGVYL